MDGTALQRRATERAQELPGAVLTYPFGEDWEVFKVCGKVFMLQTEVAGKLIVTLKATPADGAVLRAAQSDIVPGYHMNKRHWITLLPDGTLDPELVDDLVTESYLLVIEKNVPKSQWPVDPKTFGQSAASS